MCQFATEGRAVPGPDGIISTPRLQVSFVGATMPRDLENILGDVVPVIEFHSLLYNYVRHFIAEFFKCFRIAGIETVQVT